MYLVPVYGESMIDKQKLVDAVSAHSDKKTSYHTYEWFPGRSVKDLERQYSKSMSIRVMNAYTVN